MVNKVIKTTSIPKKPPRPRKGRGLAAWFIWAVAGGIIVICVLILGYYRWTHKSLAEFDGGKVTRDEFIKAISLSSGKYDPLVWKDAEQSLKIKKEILNGLIKEKILLAEAAKKDVKADEEEFKAEVASYKGGYTEESFRKMLGLKGIAYDDWIETKRNKHLTQKFIKQEVIDKIKQSPEEIRSYYKGHAGEFSHPEQVRARHILVDDFKEAQNIANELAAGGNFAEIAKKKSISPERWNGGDLGYFFKGTYPEVFDRVCFNLPVGETSQVVKSEYGYHIFKVLDKRGPEKETLEEATPYITTQLNRQKSGSAFDEWFAPLLTAANVKINEDLLGRIEVSINEVSED